MIFTKDLSEYVKEIKEEFDNNTPFAHISIKGLFQENILRAAREEISQTRGVKGRYSDHNQIKQLIEGNALVTSSPPNIRKVFTALNSPEFVKFLQELSSIENLYADDTFRGGGIHHIPPGGKLGIHLDFSRPEWNRDTFRRCNVLLYINDDWKDEWGGHLELWDDSVRNGGKCINKISPEFNTLAIFGTKKTSWHGHPYPLACPPNRARQSFAAYYYSDTPSDDLDIHSTIFE
jgi:Rps23 Pro-64 3,4-dihydroxylase Tpa1-like proline 4-hydroxylase